MVCFNARRVAEELGARGIVGMTTSGYTAFKVSSYRPKAQIYIFSDQIHNLNTMNLLWGVQCFYYNKFTTTDETIQDCNDILRNTDYVAPGDIVINTGSMPLHRKLRTNMLKVSVVE